MDNNKSFPPPPMHSRFIPPPNPAAFTTRFPGTDFCLPPPNIPFTAGFPAPDFHTSTLNVTSSPSFPPPNFLVRPPPVTNVSSGCLENDVLNVEGIIVRRRNELANPKTGQDTSHVKVYECSQLMKDFNRSLKKMKNMLSDLKNCHDDNRLELREKIMEEEAYILKLKESMHFYLANIRTLKAKISKRRRKRKKKINRSPTLTPHQIAAEHVQKLQRVAVDIEQDEKLKKDADKILSDVLRRKNEASNRIQLLNKLEKLHSARCNLSGIDPRNSGFINVIVRYSPEKLRMMWENQQKENVVEENGFRTMIDELAVDRKKENTQNTDKIQGEWLKTMFGVSDLQSPVFYANFDGLIQIRQEWDKYVVDDSDMNLKIPAGWILPRDKCDSPWKKYIYK